jgi:hypothetical protein
MTLPMYTPDLHAISLQDMDPGLADELRLNTLSNLVQYQDAHGSYDVPTGGWLLSSTATEEDAAD